MHFFIICPLPQKRPKWGWGDLKCPFRAAQLNTGLMRNSFWILFHILWDFENRRNSDFTCTRFHTSGAIRSWEFYVYPFLLTPRIPYVWKLMVLYFNNGLGRKYFGVTFQTDNVFRYSIGISVVWYSRTPNSILISVRPKLKILAPGAEVKFTILIKYSIEIEVAFI